MTPRSALGALHIGALMFGLTGVFGKLAAASCHHRIWPGGVCRAGAGGIRPLCQQRSVEKLEMRDWRRLLVSGVLLAAHWVTFFIAVKVAGVAVATLGFTAFPAFTVILRG